MPSRKTNYRSDSPEGDGAGAPSPAPFTDDEKRFVVWFKEHDEWAQSHPSHETMVALGFIWGTLQRRWFRNPKMMEYKQPVGEWRTVWSGTGVTYATSDGFPTHARRETVIAAMSNLRSGSS